MLVKKPIREELRVEVGMKENVEKKLVRSSRLKCMGRSRGKNGR